MYNMTSMHIKIISIISKKQSVNKDKIEILWSQQDDSVDRVLAVHAWWPEFNP